MHKILRKFLFSGLACAAALVVLPRVGAAAQSAQRPPVIPLEGLDAVMLLQGKEVQGKEDLAVVRGNFKYIFSTGENKAAFEKEPERYAVQLDGVCPRMGAPSRGNPDLWTVHEGKIYLFASENCKKLFVAAPHKFFEPKFEPLAITPEGAARAKTLLAKAVEAMGGATKVDALENVQFVGTWPGPNGEGSFPQTMTYSFPDRLRLDQSANVAGRAGTMTFVLAPAASFAVMVMGERRQTMTLTPATRQNTEKNFKRHPLWVVRARNSDSFVAIASGSGKIGDATVENVTVEFDGMRMTLGIEAATGRILRVTYVDRGFEGFGLFEETYSELQTVNGLTLPLVVSTTVDGKPMPMRTFKGQTFMVNAALAADLFEKPKPPAPQQ
jgi:YHS domain-containing protein